MVWELYTAQIKENKQTNKKSTFTWEEYTGFIQEIAHLVFQTQKT